MQADLDILENKLTQLVQLTQRLRADNRQLRQDLAAALNQSRQCNDKIELAQARLEALLAQIPEDATP